jgi:hypothetical protein
MFDSRTLFFQLQIRGWVHKVSRPIEFSGKVLAQRVAPGIPGSVGSWYRHELYERPCSFLLI